MGRRRQKKRQQRLADARERFAYFLCRTLGNGRWRHPDEMRAEMPAAWFEDWLSLYESDPWGDVRDDLRMARTVWATLQPHTKKKVRESTFLFDFGPKRPPTPEEYKRKSMRAYAVQGGFHAPAASRAACATP